LSAPPPPAPERDPSRGGLARQLTGALLWVAVGTVVARLLKLAALFVVLDVISDVELGVATTAITIFAIVQSLTELGLGAAVVQSEAPSRGELDRLFSLSLLVALALYALLFVAAWPLAAFYEAPALVPLIQVQGLGVVVFSLYFIPKALLTRELAFARITVADSLAGIGSGVVMIVLGHMGLGVWAIIVAEVGQRGFELVFYQMLRPWLPSRLTLDFRPIRDLVSFGLYATGSRFLYRFYIDADYLVLGKVLNLAATGTYAFAYRTVFDLHKALVSIVTQVAFPTFARMKHDRPELARYLFGIARGMTLFVGALLVLLFAHTEDVLVLLGYEQWLAAVPLVRIFCAVALVRAVTPLLPQVMNALGHARLNFVYSLLMAIGMPIAFLIGGLVADADGVAWSWLVVYPPLSFVLVVYGARLLEQPLGAFTARIFAGTPLVVLLAAAVWGIARVLAGSGLGPGPRLAVGVVVIVGATALWIWRREPELVRVLRRRR